MCPRRGRGSGREVARRETLLSKMYIGGTLESVADDLSEAEINLIEKTVPTRHVRVTFLTIPVVGVSPSACVRREVIAGFTSASRGRVFQVLNLVLMPIPK